MAKILVCYYSRSGNTRQMAEALGAAAGGVQGVEVQVLPVGKVGAKDLRDYDAIVMGSPSYYGSMAAELKTLIDESVSVHGQLAGKVGAAFASSANIAGGNETTVMDILRALLIHGMVVQGIATGDHYGPVAIGAPDERSLSQCEAFGRAVAELAVRLHG